MQTSQANTTQEFTVQQNESSFSSIWGNEMQREDFLALASGLRQFSAIHEDLGFVPPAAPYGTEHVQLTGE